jgi:guanine deaminase
MRGLKGLERKYELPTQSHLSENYGEIAWVRELSPDAEHYGDAYDRFGMFGGDHPCIMAHCVHSGQEELELIRRNGVIIAHSPESNMNLASGVAPVSRYLSLGLRVGLATDMAGGSSENMLRAMMHAIQASKLRWRLEEQGVKPLSLEQAFWLATAGGGAFFGKAGRFEPGWEFDAVVLDDSSLFTPRPLSSRDRLERAVYLADERHITAKFVGGVRLF